MKKLLRTVCRLVASPFRWVANHVFVASFDYLREKLDSRKIIKEELRKVGLGMMGIGCKGTVINGKALLYLIAIGMIFWLIGLINDTEGESKHEQRSL